MNKYQFLANAVAYIHGLIIIYLIFFLILSLQKRAPKWYRISVLLMIAIQWISLLTIGTCPLTKLEGYLRNLAGQKNNHFGFVVNWTKKLFGIGIPESLVSLLIGIITTTIIFILIRPFFPKRSSV